MPDAATHTDLPLTTRALSALINGAATTAFYASPDVVRSRRARFWVKGAIGTLLVVGALPELRWARSEFAAAKARMAAEIEAATDADDTTTDLGDEPSPTTPAEFGPQAFWDSLDAKGKASVVGVGVVTAALTAGASALIERSAFRYGERRAAAGTSLPHTMPALVYGALAAGVALIPPGRVPDPS